MIPGSNTVRGIVMLAAAAVLIAFQPDFAIVILAGFVGVAAMAVYEASQLRNLEIILSRPERVVISLGETVAYGFTASTNAQFPVLMYVRQTWPSIIDQASSTRLGVCRPGELIPFNFAIRGVVRGASEVAPAFVRLTRYSFAERIVRVDSRASIAVTPNTAAVGRLHKQLNRFFLRGYGVRTAARLGKGREFDRMRDYVRGDELRDVAWRTSARHGRLIVREYRLDRSQDVLICLDVGHRMAARVGQISRLDHSVNAAMLLAYVCNRMEDRIGFLSFSAGVSRSLAPARGMNHLREITRFATDLRPFYEHTDYIGLASDLRRRVRHRSLILLMTVLPELGDEQDLLRAVRILSPQHLVLITVFLDVNLKAAAEFLPSSKRELTKTIVARELLDSRAALMRQLRGLGALVVETPPEKFGIDSVNAYLEVKRRQLL